MTTTRRAMAIYCCAIVRVIDARRERFSIDSPDWTVEADHPHTAARYFLGKEAERCYGDKGVVTQICEAEPQAFHAFVGDTDGDGEKILIRVEPVARVVTGDEAVRDSRRAIRWPARGRPARYRA